MSSFVGFTWGFLPLLSLLSLSLFMPSICPPFILTWMIIIFVLRVFVLTPPYFIHLWDSFSQNTALIMMFLCLKPSPCLILKSSFISLAFKILSELASTFISTLVLNPIFLAASTVVPELLCSSYFSYNFCPSEGPHSASHSTVLADPAHLLTAFPWSDFSLLLSSVSIEHCVYNSLYVVCPSFTYI